MKPFTIHRGKTAGIDRANIDTDQIIPKQFLKRIERTGFGQFLFYDWRYLSDGTPNPEFELNRPENEGATILVADENFGCGSSREHAPWALQDYGFRVIIAPSFADIFYNNCLKNGLLPIRLDKEDVRYLLRQSERADYELTVSLEEQRVFDDEGFSRPFDIDPYRKQLLLKGWDEIDLTFVYEPYIQAYEQQHSPRP
ncbi:3-isopropylmalate dehydratase small subunit [Geobacillus sp. G4]|uniref:3-isopropylmalate dehydratase small subunit n=2 Tax=Geobacillus TaxID=129337 RepID=A0ABY9MGA6_9BACL|nr:MULTISPECIES: 3-isopropylmalate dehydratase small subunit [Geobacillus]AMV11844.1 isopropylmalate isomerase [Geobacillus thermoleovorans]AOL35365.1 3-isopropylmalate dehydratase small subunit [Geobacillus thermoleovorans]ESU73337.1 isopropylmalate isomerase [Geobacillus sp. MAS1]MED4973747.1 3-isopropylmalate dehydratase small subunit [Geobacillus thermoleovorans]ODA15841.1 3-isopropylmalate dehydratase small subunit [Geobacillus thermoleovorans]